MPKWSTVGSLAGLALRVFWERSRGHCGSLRFFASSLQTNRWTDRLGLHNYLPRTSSERPSHFKGHIAAELRRASERQLKELMARCAGHLSSVGDMHPCAEALDSGWVGDANHLETSIICAQMVKAWADMTRVRDPAGTAQAAQQQSGGQAWADEVLEPSRWVQACMERHQSVGTKGDHDSLAPARNNGTTAIGVILWVSARTLLPRTNVRLDGSERATATCPASSISASVPQTCNEQQEKTRRSLKHS